MSMKTVKQIMNPGWAVLRLKPTRIRLMATTDMRYRDVRLT